MNNLPQFINMMKNVNNPKQAVLSMLGTNTSPLVKNLVEMAEKGDYQGIESFARNMFKEQGRDFDKEMSEIQQMFKK